MVVGLFGYRFLLGESECNLNFWGFYDVTVSAYGLIFFFYCFLAVESECNLSFMGFSDVTVNGYVLLSC